MYLHHPACLLKYTHLKTLTKVLILLSLKRIVTTVQVALLEAYCFETFVDIGIIKPVIKYSNFIFHKPAPDVNLPGANGCLNNCRVNKKKPASPDDLKACG